MATPEGRIKDKLKRRLKKEFGDLCHSFMPVQSGYGAPALDFILCICGLFVSIETKKPGGTYTDRQKSIRDLILAAGGLVFLVDGDGSIEHAIDCIKTKSRLGGPT